MPNFSPLYHLGRLSYSWKLRRLFTDGAGALRAIDREEPTTYTFRDGLAITTPDGFGTQVVPEVALTKPYGKFPARGVMVDIGAHIGSVALLAAYHNPLLRVFGYEPNPRNFEVLVRNVHANHLEDQVSVFPNAVAGTREQKRMFLRGSPHSNFEEREDDAAATVIEVEAITLADIFTKQAIRHCDLLKVDCEGAEFELLYAAPKQVLRSIDKIRMEYHDNLADSEQTVDALTQFLARHGFERTRKQAAGVHGGGGEIGIAWFERRV